MRHVPIFFIMLLLLAACTDSPATPLPTLPPGTPAADVDLARNDFLRRNYVSNLAFAPDGALWAAVADGVIRWDLDNLTYHFYGPESGLGREGASDLAVDARGRVVAATATGVHRFDGATWISLPALAPEVRVRRVLSQGDDTLWAGTTQGLWRYEDEAWKAMDTGDIGRMALRDGRLWYRQGDRLVRLDTRSGESTVVERTGGPVGNLLGIDADGAPWVGVDYDAVYRWDGEMWRTAFDGADLVCSAAFGSDGTPYLGTCGGFHAYAAGVSVREEGAWRPIGEPPDPNIVALALAPDGTLAIGTPDGINVGSDGAWRTLQLGPLHRITSMAVAPAGELFVAYGTFSSRPDTPGVSRLNADGWTHWEDLGNVTEVIAAPDGTIWAAGQCTLSSFRNEAWHADTRDCEQIFGHVMGVAFAGSEEVWLGTPYRLVRYVNGDFAQEDLLVSDIAADRDGAVWVQVWTGRQGEYILQKYHGGELVDERPLDVAQNGRFLADSTGQVWLLGSEAGLLPLGPAAGDPLPLPFDGAAVTATAAGPGGALWFATDEALIRFEDDQWRFARVDPDWTAPSALAVGPDGTLWRGDARGVARVMTADR